MKKVRIWLESVEEYSDSNNDCLLAVNLNYLNKLKKTEGNIIYAFTDSNN